MHQIALTDPKSAPAKVALAAYYAELAARFPEGFEPGLSRDPDAALMRPPHGGFFVATQGDEITGCVGLKGGPDYAEVKRLWVAESARGAGLARALMQAVEDHAKALHIPLIRLDTNRALPEAIAMYHRFGWTEIPRFNDDPYAHVFFEKRLGTGG